MACLARVPFAGSRPADLLVPAGAGTVVVALYATVKAKLGDVFYDGAAARADPMIDQWKRETAYEEKP